MLVDTHCHLDAAEFDADREAVIERAGRQGVGCMVVPAVARDNFEAVRALGKRAEVKVAFGIHPLYINTAQESDLVALREYLTLHAPVAVGEIGLDMFVEGIDGARQAFFFRAQLKLAREFDLPVILHIRRAQDCRGDRRPSQGRSRAACERRGGGLGALPLCRDDEHQQRRWCRVRSLTSRVSSESAEPRAERGEHS